MSLDPLECSLHRRIKIIPYLKMSCDVWSFFSSCCQHMWQFNTVGRHLISAIVDSSFYTFSDANLLCDRGSRLSDPPPASPALSDPPQTSPVLSNPPLSSLPLSWQSILLQILNFTFSTTGISRLIMNN